jgi:selenocysteine lyase/cysteine desulfurase
MGGGDMFKRVTLQGSTWNELPYKFEAGTPAIAEAVGLGAAVDYLTGIGMNNISQHERIVVNYALDRLSEIRMDSLSCAGSVTAWRPSRSKMSTRTISPRCWMPKASRCGGPSLCHAHKRLNVAEMRARFLRLQRQPMWTF